MTKEGQQVLFASSRGGHGSPAVSLSLCHEAAPTLRLLLRLLVLGRGMCAGRDVLWQSIRQQLHATACAGSPTPSWLECILRHRELIPLVPHTSGIAAVAAIAAGTSLLRARLPPACQGIRRVHRPTSRSRSSCRKFILVVGEEADESDCGKRSACSLCDQSTAGPTRAREVVNASHRSLILLRGGLC